MCRASGEKFAKAKDWDIVVVNGRWLSDIVLGEIGSMAGLAFIWSVGHLNFKLQFLKFVIFA